MLFPTPEYALFFLAVFAGAWAVRRWRRGHQALLLGASYFFYGWWDARFLPLLVALSLLAAFVGRRLQNEQRPRLRRAWLAGGITVSLATLGFFKYLGFAAAGAVGLLERLGIRLGESALPDVALPVGISFFVFHAISLMVDAWRGKIPVRVGWLEALLYVAFFPQLVAGPILRASAFLPQLARPPDPENLDVARALELIAVGLAKKVLIANFLATRLVDPAFSSPAAHPGLEALLAIYAYAAQIYCDFSGYTDMAIGSALLLGYRFPENFAAPYLAASPQDFWHRWHISLSTWLRDYLFIPLGGSRRGPARTQLNLFATMVLGGLWHGAAWTFVIWGAFHGAGLVVHRAWAASRAGLVARVRASPAWPVLARVLTFHFVCLGWVLFRAPSLEAAGELLAAIARPWTAGAWLSAAAAMAVALGILGQAVAPEVRARLRARFARWPLVAQGLAFALAVLLVEALGPQGVAPFIYFQF